MEVTNKKDILPVEMLDGIFRRTLVYNKDAMLCVFDMRKGATIELHSHPAAQLGYVISGKVEFWWESKENKNVVIPGDTYMIPGTIAHGAIMLEDSVILECFTPSRSEYAR